MNELVGFAEKMLKAYGEFHPFGGYLDESAKIVHVGVEPKADWNGEQERLDALVESFQSLSRESHPLAFGIVTNVSLPDAGTSSDAIRVFLEHKDGYCADVFFHYKLTEGRIADITNMTAQQGAHKIFLKYITS